LQELGLRNPHSRQRRITVAFRPLRCVLNELRIEASYESFGRFESSPAPSCRPVAHAQPAHPQATPHVVGVRRVPQEAGTSAAGEDDIYRPARPNLQTKQTGQDSLP
jgi:hypothetical protein